MAELVAKKYGSALFEIAVQEDKIDVLSEQAKIIVETMEQEKDFTGMLLHPHISALEKIALLKRIFSGMDERLDGLLHLVVKKNRENVLHEILTYFLERIKEHQGLVDADVYSAVPLNENQVELIKQHLCKKTNKQVEVQLHEAPYLIGGLLIKIGDVVIDSSIKKQLGDMKEALLNFQFDQERSVPKT